VSPSTRRPGSSRRLPDRSSLVGWAALAVVATALDGAAGAVAAVLVAAALLAGARPRAIGIAGVLALVATPLLVVLDGVPSTAEVSPGFVSRSLWPHHLTFVGFVLIGASVVVELGPALRAHLADAPGAEGGDDHAPPAPDAPGSGPLGRTSPAVRIALVAATAAGALAACVAVLGA
jgi:hypothetical protein